MCFSPVCGLERKHRCNYFKWADDPLADVIKVGAEDHQAHNPQTFEPLRIELARMIDASELCCLVEREYDEMKDSYPADDIESGLVRDKPNFLLRNEQDAQVDDKDGVIQSWIKLGKIDNPSSTKHTSPKSTNGVASLISESLYLFSLVASSQQQSEQWYPVLCAIITGGSSTLRQLAKRCLQQLCGGNQDLYHRIRDHYVYGYQFRKLLMQSEGVLDNALIVTEMAKQCGMNWRDSEVEFSTLHPAGLLGVGDLVSEDCLSESYEQAVNGILDELLRTAGTSTRQCNWRNFCFLPEIPAQGKTSSWGTVLEQLVHRPPIMSIMWLGSCLRGSNQFKLFQLADVALDDAKSNDVSNITDGDYHNSDQVAPSDPVTNSDHTLFSLTVTDLHAFIVDFIVNGRSKDLRCVAGRVALKLASRLNSADKNLLMNKMVDGLLRGVAGKFGRACEEFIVSPMWSILKTRCNSRLNPCMLYRTF